jgi:hypothetical protein
VVTPSVFVSYRRSDAPGYAGRLYDHLKEMFGKEHVFMDIDTLEIGVDFSARIGQALDECHALLAVIGPSWVDVKDRHDHRRLDDPHDFVRKEILAGLIREDVLVIPVLVQDADMPDSEDLPAPLEPLAFRNALRLSDHHWEYDMGRLARAIRRAAEQKATSTVHDKEKLAKALETEEAKEEEKLIVSPHPLPPPAVKPMWFAIAGAVALVMLISLFILLGGDDDPIISSDLSNGRLAFLSDEGGSTELVTTEPDGTDPQRITGSGADILRPDWSPDGTMIVFTSDQEGDYDLWKINADGTELDQLTSGPASDGAPEWSPDGRRIAFRSNRSGNMDIWMLDLETGDSTQLTHDPADEDAPDWSAKNRIAFQRRAGDFEIFTMNPEGDEVEQVTDNDAYDVVPSWSPDGTRLVYRSDADGNLDIWTIGSDGEDPRNLTNTPNNDHHPFWSPDGELIVFDSVIEGNTDILVMTATGDNVRNLTPSPANEDSPSWQAILD